MTGAHDCSRLWQVEAVLDGCLSQADSTSFERHVEICEICRSERAALARLKSVAERMPSATSTPLRRRALHQQLLRRANELSVSTPPPSWWRKGKLTLAMGVAALLLVLGGWHWAPWRTTSLASAEPSFELTTTPSTRWHVLERGSSMRLVCDAGALTVSVRKLLPGQRFSIALPDGELEVRGTRFVIEVADHHTQRLTVTEGRVALRLQNRPEMLVGAGQAWSASPEAPSAARVLPVPVTAPPAAVTTPPAAEPGSALRPTTTPKPALPAAAASFAERPIPNDAVADFVEAMAAFSRSDFGTAEQLFASFEQHHPQSSHREDVLFLRALSRSRRGDVAGAQALAREYLRQYPNGFRVPEATQIAAPSAQAVRPNETSPGVRP